MYYCDYPMYDDGFYLDDSELMISDHDDDFYDYGDSSVYRTHMPAACQGLPWPSGRAGYRPASVRMAAADPIESFPIVISAVPKRIPMSAVPKRIPMSAVPKRIPMTVPKIIKLLRTPPAPAGGVRGAAAAAAARARAAVAARQASAAPMQTGLQL